MMMKLDIWLYSFRYWLNVKAFGNESCKTCTLGM